MLEKFKRKFQRSLENFDENLFKFKKKHEKIVRYFE